MSIRKRASFVAAVVSLLSVSGVHAQEGGRWLCLPDETTGFKFNGTRWASAKLDSSRDRYLLAWKPEDKQYAWSSFGETLSIPCLGPSPGKTISCDFYGVILISFNVTHLRYSYFYTAGYVDGVDNEKNTPFVEIGKCSPF